MPVTLSALRGSAARVHGAAAAQHPRLSLRSTTLLGAAAAPRPPVAGVAARALRPTPGAPASSASPSASRLRPPVAPVATRAAYTDAPSADAPPASLADQLKAAGIKTVAVAGATGGVGRAVVRALLATSSSAPSPDPPALRVRALARSESRAATVLPPFGANSQLSVAVADVEQFATLPAALRGADALVIATGPPRTMNPLGPYEVDYQGNLNLFAAAQQAGVKHVVFVTSIGADDLVNPLNLFFLILFWKKQAEAALQRSGLPYTIIRPGGLRDAGAAGGIVLGGPGTWGVPPLRSAGSILRSQVADLVVGALANPGVSAGKVVEAIAKDDAPSRPVGQLFSEV